MAEHHLNLRSHENVQPIIDKMIQVYDQWYQGQRSDIQLGYAIWVGKVYRDEGIRENKLCDICIRKLRMWIDTLEGALDHKISGIQKIYTEDIDEE